MNYGRASFGYLAVFLMILFSFTRVLAQEEEIPPDIILVTGFEPFGGGEINSSWEAVSQLDDWQLDGNRQVVVLELPVVWETADDLLFDAIEQYEPILVINVGQGGGSIELEQYAHNRTSRTPDNDGSLPYSPFISADGPDVYVSEIDVFSILAHIDKLDLDVSVVDSSSAGSYLCNYVSYSSYDYLARFYPETPTLFVHVPPIHDLEAQADRLSEIVLVLEVVVQDALFQMDNMIVIHDREEVETHD